MKVFILSDENRILGVFFDEENVVQYVKDQFPNMVKGRDYITFRPGDFGDLNGTNYIDVLSFGCEFQYRIQMLQTKDELTSDFLMKELDNRTIFECDFYKDHNEFVQSTFDVDYSAYTECLCSD